MPAIQIPNDWAPTQHQQPLFAAMQPSNGKDRGICVWHRRAGKDSAAINLTVCKAFQKVGTYWHLLPTSVQARKVIWNETDRYGRRIIEQAIPESIRERTLDNEMSIRLVNGSLWQLGGGDNYNSLVGSNVRGVVFSEYALTDPAAWDYVRPILVENGGWALFIYTPRGRNHGWRLWEATKDSRRWFRSMLDITQTQREDGTAIVTPEQVEQEKADGMSEEAAEQEFYCSFAAGVVGAYFARSLEVARTQGRIASVPWDPRLAVHLWLDIGIDDMTACWFEQRQGFRRQWFRYDEWRDTSMMDVGNELAKTKYRIATVNLPHDGNVRDKGTLKTVKSYFEDAFAESGAAVIVHPATDKQVQIEAGRQLVTRSWIDEQACQRGLDALLNYAKLWDEKRRTYIEKPVHNWASHGADAWMLAGVDDYDEPVLDLAQDVMPRNTNYKPRVRRSVGMR